MLCRQSLSGICTVKSAGDLLLLLSTFTNLFSGKDFQRTWCALLGHQAVPFQAECISMLYARLPVSMDLRNLLQGGYDDALQEAG